MEFIEEIEKCFNHDLGIGIDEYRVQIFGKIGALILGVKDIFLFSDTKIIANLKKNKIEINGINLFIKKFAKGELFVGGKINKVELL